MIRVRTDGAERLLTVEAFEDEARRGVLGPNTEVCIPALTGDRFRQAREVPLFAAAYDPRPGWFRDHFRLDRPPILTGLLILAAVVMFQVTLWVGDGAVTREALIVLGAKARSRLIEEGETWRLLAANLLHRDLTHLLLNLFTFGITGSALEAVYRRGDLLLLLVLSGVASMGLSVVMTGADTVGASGIVFAFLAAAAVFGLRYRAVLPRRHWIFFGVIVLGYGLTMFAVGLLGAETDNWGHAGGAMAGIVFGVVVPPRLMRLEAPTEGLSARLRPLAWAVAVASTVTAVGPILPRWLDHDVTRTVEPGLRFNVPAYWVTIEDPRGYTTFGNHVDAFLAVRCLPDAEKDLNALARWFVDDELGNLAAHGDVAGLVVQAPAPSTLAGEPALRVSFRFLSRDGPLLAEAEIFRFAGYGCTAVASRRPRTPATTVARLTGVVSGMQRGPAP